jgi:hypothetical protein
LKNDAHYTMPKAAEFFVDPPFLDGENAQLHSKGKLQPGSMYLFEMTDLTSWISIRWKRGDGPDIGYIDYWPAIHPTKTVILATDLD